MNHSEVHSYMAEYLEGELDLTKRALLDAHLDACEGCNVEFAEMRGTIALVRGLPDPEPPPFLVETVMRRIRDGESGLGFADRVRGWAAALARPQVALPATALAVGLAMAIGGLDPSSVPGLEDQAALGTQIRMVAGATTHGASAPQVGQFGGGRVPYLTVGNAPPAVARVPRVTITLPSSGSSVLGPGQLAVNESGASRLVTRWPTTRSIRNPLPVAGDPQVRSVPVVNRVSVEGVGPERTTLQGSAFAASDDSSQARGAAVLDKRIEGMIRRPATFAAKFASLSLAEQELWLPPLAARANEIGRSEEALQALRLTGDPVASRLAAAFSSQLTGLGRPEVAALEASGDASER